MNDNMFLKPTVRVRKDRSLHEMIVSAENALRENNQSEEARAIKVSAHTFNDYFSLKGFLSNYVNIEEVEGV